jgi:hypothetical protein
MDHMLVADECWVALATLAKDHPNRQSFSAPEILKQIRQEGAHVPMRPGVQAHIHQHNVANVPPSTARYRMFYRMDNRTYRLYRPGDPCHSERSGKIHPNRLELPPKYHSLLDWYERNYRGAPQEVTTEKDDPILSMRGMGREIWVNVGADAYVRSLREGWDDSVMESSEATSLRSTDAGQIWQRLVGHQGTEFKTKTGLPFTHRVEGDSGIWFFRDGQRVNMRLSRRELEEAVQRLPLDGPTDLKEFRDPSYLYGLLTDRRIIG